MTRTPAPTAAAIPARELLPDLVLRPVREGQAFEAAVEQLASAIRLGIYAKGEALPPERELAARLGMARATLRDAIAALREMGLVETRRGRAGGTFVLYDGTDAAAAVTLPTHDQIEDALAFRRVVEPGTAHLAAGRALDAQDRNYLVTCLKAVSDPANDRGAHRIADAQFHLAIAGVSGSPSLLAAVRQSQDSVHILLATIPVLSRNIEHSHSDHRALVDAVLSGRPDLARRIAEEHCDRTAALLRGLLP
jgi:GntR family transcriptional regulator, transcriptional repressor for pyruvate dehydrogenase complex